MTHPRAKYFNQMCLLGILAREVTAAENCIQGFMEPKTGAHATRISAFGMALGRMKTENESRSAPKGFTIIAKTLPKKKGGGGSRVQLTLYVVDISYPTQQKFL
jgi:hypothetical protein